MLEAMSNFDFSDQNLQLNDHNKDIKLPKIDRPISKQQPSVEKSTTKFPSLKLQPSYHSNPTINQNIINTNFIKKIQEEEEQFVVEVEKKLKMVLEEQNLMDLEDSYGSDDDFEQKINENKQIIKKHKQKIQNQIHSNNFINLQPNTKTKPHKKQLKLQTKNKNRNESLYEKRPKQYRDVSAESKYLQKKKQTVATKVIQDFASKQAQSKQSIIVNKVIKIQDKQKISIDSTTKNQQQLFDNIQNFLENPKKSSIDVHSIKMQNGYQRPIKQLEDKIRQIDEKINSDKINSQKNHSYQKTVSDDTFSQNRLVNTPPTLDIYHNSSSNEWRKVQLVKNKIQANDTTFDKEIQKINRYLEKGESSLEKYVQNHKILLELQIWKKNKIKTISDNNKVTRRTQE